MKNPIHLAMDRVFYLRGPAGLEPNVPRRGCGEKAPWMAPSGTCGGPKGAHTMCATAGQVLSGPSRKAVLIEYGFFGCVHRLYLS